MRNSLQWFILRHDLMNNQEKKGNKQTQTSLQMTIEETSPYSQNQYWHGCLDGKDGWHLVDSNACLVQMGAGSWVLAGAHRHTGCWWVLVVDVSLCTGGWHWLFDADAYLCTGNTATCCKMYRGSVRA